jgi:hypothetical protein
MIPNFIIPSEYEMLEALKNAGRFGIVMLSHLFKIKLKIVWDKANAKYRSFLLSGKKMNLTSAFQEIEAELKIVLE